MQTRTTAPEGVSLGLQHMETESKETHRKVFWVRVCVCARRTTVGLIGRHGTADSAAELQTDAEAGAHCICRLLRDGVHGLHRREHGVQGFLGSFPNLLVGDVALEGVWLPTVVHQVPARSRRFSASQDNSCSKKASMVVKAMLAGWSFL